MTCHPIKMDKTKTVKCAMKAGGATEPTPSINNAVITKPTREFEVDWSATMTLGSLAAVGVVAVDTGVVSIGGGGQVTLPSCTTVMARTT